MNIYPSPPSQAEQAGLAQNRRFEHPALALSRIFLRPDFIKKELAWFLATLLGLVVLLNLGLEVYRLFIGPFVFPNLIPVG